MLRAPFIALTLMTACGSGEDSSDSGASPGQPCEGYPEGAIEPMALGEVISPYSWPQAIHRGDGRDVELDLGDAPCNTADDIDWSPFDVLLFVSIPAW